MPTSDVVIIGGGMSYNLDIIIALGFRARSPALRSSRMHQRAVRVVITLDVVAVLPERIQRSMRRM